MQNRNQSRLGHTRLPALGVCYVYLFQVLIVLFTFVVIGHCNCFGFTTLKWKPLYYVINRS